MEPSFDRLRVGCLPTGGGTGQGLASAMVGRCPAGLALQASSRPDEGVAHSRGCQDVPGADDARHRVDERAYGGFHTQ
jgi:hypothetical protein